MTSQVKKTMVRFGGATVIALVLGLGAGAGNAITEAATTPASTVAPASTPAHGATGNGAVPGVTLTGCISNLNC
jgi:hypothetical protein